MFEQLLRAVNLDVGTLTTLLRRVIESTILRGRLVSATILNGDTSATVPHGLGRAHLGGMVVSQTAAASVYVEPADDTTTVTVTASAAVGADTTITLWVFA